MNQQLRQPIPLSPLSSLSSFTFIFKYPMLINLLEDLLDVGPKGYEAVKELIKAEPNIQKIIQSHRYLNNIYEQSKLSYLNHWLTTECHTNYSLDELTNLNVLYLWNNRLMGGIPAEIGNLTNLQLLYAVSNQLTSLPAEIGNLTNLQKLFLSDNQLTSLPTEIGNLINLQKLFLQNNRLTILPAEIGNLTNLQVLSLYNNQLTSIPADIGNLTNLQQLSLKYNQLTILPAEIENKLKQQGTRIYM